MATLPLHWSGAVTWTPWAAGDRRAFLPRDVATRGEAGAVPARVGRWFG